MGIKFINFDIEQYKVKNKKNLILLILVSLVLISPILLSFLYSQIKTSYIYEFYIGLLGVIVLYSFPIFFLLLGIYGFFKKQAFWGYNSLYFKAEGKMAQFISLLYLLIGISGILFFTAIFLGFYN